MTTNALAPGAASDPVTVAAAAPAFASFRVLLAFYAIVPISIALAALDALVFHHRLFPALPRHPDELVLFTIVFNLPHILASHILYFDREYAATYWKPIVLTVLALIALTVLVVATAGLELDFFVAIVLTVFHIVAQQVGMTRAQLRSGGFFYQAWKVGAVLLALTVYLPIQMPIVLGWSLIRVSTILAVGLLPLTLVCALVLSFAARTPTGRAYLWANQVMLMAMPVLTVFGYPLFALLMPRVVHDLSAFYVYIVHDRNRNRETRPNLLYGAPGLRRLPTYLVGPSVAILAAFGISRLPLLIGIPIIALASGTHYFMEGVTWKRGAINRRFMSFK